MRTILYYLGVLWAVCGLSGCEEYTALGYENDPRLYFFNSIDIGQKDSIAHSFFVLKDDQMRDTVWLDIRTMGDTAGYDRPVEIVLTNTGNPNTAIPGKHFLAFDNDEIREHMVVPAGKVKASIPVIILRDPSLNTSVIRMELAIGENKYFKSGIDKWSKFVITTTARAAKPLLWDTRWVNIFGAWGPVKMKFIVDYVGYTDFDIWPSDGGLTDYLRGKARQKLLEYNLAHPGNELKEANNALVEF